MIKILSLLLLSVQATVQQDCLIDAQVYYDDHYIYAEPIVVNPENLEIIYAKIQDKDARYINIADGNWIIVSCGDSSFLNYVDSPDGKTFLAKCTKNSHKLFEDLNNNTFIMEDIRCRSNVLETVTTVEDKTCAEGKGTIIEVGIPVSSDKTIQVYEVCFDSTSKNVFYSKFTMVKVQAYRPRFYDRPYPESDDESFYNLSSTVYNIYYNRKTTINSLLGLPLDSTKYFPSSSESEPSYRTDLVRDTVAYYSQFFYFSQQAATFRLFNMVPIWDIYKSGATTNWDRIRFNLAYTLRTHKIDMEIFVGTYGVSTLPHEETNEDIEIYLHQDGDTKTIPVPRLMWHLVYNPIDKTAIVLVSVNNPFVVKITDTVCKDISAEHGWEHALSWDRDREDLGHVYACTYGDFKSVVTFLPDLEVTGILNSSSTVTFSVFVGILSLVLLNFL